MRRPGSYAGLERFGRVRLSRHFPMRTFMHSEIGSFYGIPNLPHAPEEVIAAGRGLAEHLLEPLVETFGPLDIRSGYRSPELNHFGATEAKPQKCSGNDRNWGEHIWGCDSMGRLGACVSLGVPWFAPQFDRGRDWRDLAWWLYDHLPAKAVCFFPKGATFNLTWSEACAGPPRIDSYIAPRGRLTGPGAAPEPISQRAARYGDFPVFRGLAYPPIPEVTA